MTDEVKDAKELTLNEVIDIRNVMVALGKHQGWTILCERMKIQLDRRIDTMVAMPLKSMDQVLEQEYMKGEAAMLRVFLLQQRAMVEELDDRIVLLKSRNKSKKDE